MKDNPSSDSGTALFTSIIGLWFTSAGYAALLSSKTGRQWADQNTTFSVVIGVLLTLFWLALCDAKTAKKTFIYFALSGSPMILRSLYTSFQESNGA